jgi:formate hydrogenlyase transcriptional activator
VIRPPVLELQPLDWLLENGPKELEQLFRTIVHHPSAPILVADDDGNYRDASFGAAKLLGIPREEIIGRSFNDFTEPSLKPQISDLWQAFLQQGEQTGTLQLLALDGAVREVEYTAKGSVLPVRHVLVLRDKTVSAETEAGVQSSRIPSWIEDYALFLLDIEGLVAAWYSGAERIYGYATDEVLGQHVSLLYPNTDTLLGKPLEELHRSVDEGHFGSEGWCIRKDGSRFWANTITAALKNENDGLQGFARVVRDFTDRHQRDEDLLQKHTRHLSLPVKSTIAGIVSGEFDRIPEANDAFLEMVGYSRDDLLAGRLRWPDLTPPEYFSLDELAHEESLRFGACTPFEKELTRKDGTRVRVLVATAVLKLAPFRWITFVQDLGERDRQEHIPQGVVNVKHDFKEIIGQSAALQRVLAQVELVAPTDATVLILGETGTGKELVARAVHGMSPRRNYPFITLNCAAIPTGLLESELFGYERGAFTGALSQKLGRFELANGGTLFLDEVGDIPLDIQPKLLRALQEKAFERLGGTRTIPIDVRLVAATNRNLTEMMGHKLFRSDLYYRLKVFPITTPPLRNRAEDIPLLVYHFTQKYARKMQRDIQKIPSETMRTIVNFPWPGNVRELENFIERSVILSPGASLRAPLAELPIGMPASSVPATLAEVERQHILHVLRETDGVVTTAAARLGLPRTTLNALMQKLGITRSDVFVRRD